MKQLMIVALMLLTISLNLNAQDTHHKPYQYGITAGPTAPWFHAGDPTFSGFEHSSIGLIGGFYQRIKLNDRFGILHELLYQGGGIKNPEEKNRVFQPHYISTPIVITYAIQGFNIHAGGYYSYLITAKNYDFKGDNFDWKTGKKTWDWYHSGDYGLVFGFEFNLYNAYIGADFNLGLRDVRKVYYDDDKMMGNKNTSINARLKIPLNE